MTRYAKGTTVSVEKSRIEVERTLARYGAKGFAYSWQHHDEEILPPGAWQKVKISREVVAIEFLMKERRVRLEVPMPHPLDLKRRSHRETDAVRRSRAEVATRQRWRALCLVIKAKLEAVEGGISTLEAEFLANVVLDSGFTVGQVLVPRLSEAVSSGRLLPPAGGEG